jgi:hypothetical protein
VSHRDQKEHNGSRYHHLNNLQFPVSLPCLLQVTHITKENENTIYGGLI